MDDPLSKGPHNRDHILDADRTVPPINRLLARLSSADAALILPLLAETDLNPRQVLERKGERIEDVFFISSGLISVVAMSDNGSMVEVGLLGREGMSGVPVILGTDSSPYQTFAQSPVRGWKLRSADLRTAMAESPMLTKVLLLYAHTLMTQIGLTVLANSKNTVEQRLARWLLMAQDRLGNMVPLTHELLSMMLGVRRPGVSVALQAMERRGVLRSQRGIVTIIDRYKLTQLSAGSYGNAEAEYDRVFSSCETHVGRVA